MTTIHYANPDETTFTGACFEFHFGAYGATIVRVYQRPGHVEDALETAAKWLAENAPGIFEEPDYAAAKNEIMGETGQGDDMIAEEDIAARAEADLTYTESGWLPSWEWTVNELDEDPLCGATFDRFDIAAAYATYWAAYHMGQSSHGYARLCAAQRILSNCDLRFDSLSDNGKAVYRGLVLQDGR